MRRMNYNICVLCPICSKNGEQAYKCDVHRTPKCKQEQCLHYIKEEEVVQSKGTLICDKSTDQKNTATSTEMFVPWFEALDKKVRTT